MLFFKQAKKPNIRKEVLADEKKGVESSRSFLFVHCFVYKHSGVFGKRK